MDDVTATTMQPLECLAVLWLACCVFVGFYGPQPLLPVMQQEFGVSAQEISLLITVTIAPLGFAPLIYGTLLGARGSRSVVWGALPFFLVALMVPVFAESFWTVFWARVVQGLSIPAIALGLMTYISSRTRQDHMQRAMTLYATATMIGAYAGRIVSGCVATAWGWRASFVFFALLIVSAVPLTKALKNTGETRFTSVGWRDACQVLVQRGLLPVLLVGPLCIFAHASILNFIPFRMKVLDPGISETGISLMYASTLLCSVWGMASQSLCRILGNEMRVACAGTVCFLLATPLLLWGNIYVFFLASLGLGTGFALVYTTMPGIVNQMSTSPKNITNAVYLSVYYTASALGTWVLTAIYSNSGLEVYTGVLAAVFITALSLCIKIVFFSPRSAQAE